MVTNTFRLLLCLPLVAVGCQPQNSTHHLTGTAAERVAGIERVIASTTAVPSTIEDAQLIEQQFGDNSLGPADYRSYIWIKVSPEDVEHWKSVLQTPPAYTPSYGTPPTQPEWWLSETDFNRLTKYDAFSFFERQGWIVIDNDGNIFAMTHTQ